MAQGNARIVVLVDVGDGRVVLASRAFSALVAARTSLRELFLLGIVVAIVIGGLFSFAFMRATREPARELQAVALAIARGELRARAHTERDGELGELGHAIDEMAERIADRIARLETQEARLSIVLDAMTECVFVTDARTRIVITNAAFERLVGGNVLGKTAIEAIRSPELHRAVLAAQSGQAVDVEFEPASGETRMLFATLSPLVSGGVVAVLHDVTKLRMADRIRRDFVANASHELRTPLTAIRGFAETLRDGASNDPDTTARFLDVILKHTLRLQRIVDDLVALSRAEAPDARLELGPVRVDDVIAEVVRGLASHAAARSQQVQVSLPSDLPLVKANADALDQVLVNLVDNAIKYTPQNGAIRVTASIEPEHVCIAVHNSGPGIPAQHLERIFERFYRVDPGRSREVGGTGLGLSIVRHLVQRMGAEIAVESGPERGTTFRVRTPRLAS
jgi:two-component system, OmpR family, phosphate regulon sensor histidine kinase PhoR